MWSAVLYILLCGFPPFHHDDIDQLWAQMKAGRYDLPSPYWDSVSNEAQQFISEGVVVVDPAKRFTALRALEHPYISGNRTLVLTNEDENNAHEEDNPNVTWTGIEPDASAAGEDDKDLF